jgi:hypothetical protein
MGKSLMETGNVRDGAARPVPITSGPVSARSNYGGTDNYEASSSPARIQVVTAGTASLGTG